MMQTDCHTTIIARDDAKIEFAQVPDSNLTVMRLSVEHNGLFSLFFSDFELLKNVHGAMTAFIAAIEPPRILANTKPAQPEDPEPPAAA